MARTHLLPALTSALLVCWLSGCGGGGGPTITGSVNFDGQPVSDAQVYFDREEGKVESAVCTTDASGKFQVKPRSKNGETLAPGKYIVRVAKWVDKSGKTPSEEDFGQLQAAGLLKNALPAKYNDRDFPQLNAEIKPGKNELPAFELKR